MAREVTDADNTAWACIQAYAGLHTDRMNLEAGKIDDESGEVTVVCTPSGGARTVRLALPADWETGLSDEDLVKRIARGS